MSDKPTQDAGTTGGGVGEDKDQPRFPPFGGRLTQAVERAMALQVEQRLAEGIPPEELAQRLDDFPWEKVFREAAEPIHADLLDGLDELVGYLGDQEHSLERAMAEVWGPADDLYRAASYIAYEVGGAVSKASQQHGAKLYALLGAHGRAVRTAGEVRHLAMGGFQAGAVARWRSLHDLAVVSLVLRKAGEEIAERYLAYSRIEVWEDMKYYQKHATALGRAPFAASEIGAASAAADSVLAQWGPEMGKVNGWAAPLFSEKKRFNFLDLEGYAGLAHLRPFYRLGNHHVHAGPRAAELNMRGDVIGRRITTGQSVFADIAEICHGSIISLSQASSALVTSALEEDLGGDVDLLVGLLAQAKFVDDAGVAYSAAAERARTRGWFTHRASD